MPNEITIEVILKQKEDYQNKFHPQTLSSDLSNYIYEECIGKPLQNKVKLEIYPMFNMSSFEKEDLKSQISKNYQTMMEEEKLHLKYRSFWKTIIFFLGILLLLVYYLLEKIHGFIISEVIMILAWVMIWEPVYQSLFEDHKQKIKIQRYQKLSNCEIEFIEKEDGNENH